MKVGKTCLDCGGFFHVLERAGRCGPCFEKLATLTMPKGRSLSPCPCAVAAAEKAKRLEKVARVCALQKDNARLEAPGELVLYLSRLTPAEAKTQHGEENPWQIDLPDLGVTVYGKSPKAAFREALKAIVDDEQARDDENVSREEAQRASVLRECSVCGGRLADRRPEWGPDEVPLVCDRCKGEEKEGD